jgi:hypothetical protein
MANFTENSDTTLVTISEINYNSEPSINANDWIELWNFSSSKDADISGWKLTDEDSTHIFTIPQNTIIKPDHRIVVVRDESAFTDLYSDVDDIPGLNFGLGSKSDAVRLFNAQSELVAEVNYTDSLPWPFGAGGQGRTMELLDPHNPANDPTNWFDGCIGGSPGKAYSPCGEPIVFSEINYNSDNAFDTKDWVELRNTGNTTVDLSGWKFMDDADTVTHEFFIADGTKLAPQQNLVLSQDIAAFKEFNPAVTNVLGSFNFSLSNGGEWIRMYDKNEKIRLSVRYNDKSPWPQKADGDGNTLELLDSTAIMNSGSNWFAGCYGGSPGTYYSAPCKSNGVDDMTTDTDFAIYPNPFNNEINVDFKSEEQVVLNLIQFDGKVIFTEKINAVSAKINPGNLQQGIYLLNINYQDGTIKTIKLIKQ